MNNVDLFNRTKQRLAFSYAGVMGLILSVLGFGVYEFTVYDRRLAIDREIESVAGTIHDSLESKLVQPDRISPAARLAIPNLCSIDLDCDRDEAATNRHVTGVLGQGKYYLVLLSSRGEVRATAGSVPPNARLSPLATRSKWTDIIDGQGRHYRQFLLGLHTVTSQDWGKLRVGRNTEDLTKSIESLQFTLLVTIPIAILLIGVASWYLASSAMRPIYEAYDRLQIFTANVAHELRTPLATNQLILDEYIGAEEIDSQPIDILSTIRSQNMRLIRLVGDLLFLARLDRSTIEDNDEFCNLDEIVEDLGEEFNLLSQAHEIIISIADRIKPVRVKGDIDRLTRLVANLLENATKYSPENSEIIVNICRTRTHIRLSITDRGIGIPLSEQSKIFDRFYRVNSDRSRQTGGTGLGLAIVKSIADTYGAKVRVKSQVGAGSTFIVDFPRSIESALD